MTRRQVMHRYLIFAIFLWLLPIAALAQKPDDGTRDLWDTAFLQKRPEGKKQTKRSQPVHYRVVGKKPAPAGVSSTDSMAVVGVTVWKLRPSKPSDDQSVRQL